MKLRIDLLSLNFLLLKELLDNNLFKQAGEDMFQ